MSTVSPWWRATSRNAALLMLLLSPQLGDSASYGGGAGDSHVARGARAASTEGAVLLGGGENPL
jgi:hypothetical protein